MLAEIPYQVQVDVPSLLSDTIHKQEEITVMEATLEFNKPKDLAITARLLFEGNAYAAKDSSNITISPKSIKTMFLCLSTPKSCWGPCQAA